MRISSVGVGDGTLKPFAVHVDFGVSGGLLTPNELPILNIHRRLLEDCRVPPAFFSSFRASKMS